MVARTTRGKRRPQHSGLEPSPFRRQHQHGRDVLFFQPGRLRGRSPRSVHSAGRNGHVAFLEKVVGLFVQDKLRVSPKLSTTVGLRYDWQNYFHDDNNFAARGSFAFAPVAGGRTVIRGGAGVFYDRSGPRPIQDILRYDGVRLLRYVVVDPGFPDPFPSGQPPGSEAPWTRATRP